MICPSCQGEDVVEDSSQSLIHFVCVNCGTVVNVENGLRADKAAGYGNEESLEVGKFTPKSLGYYKKNKKLHSTTYNDVRNSIYNLSAECRIPRYIRDEAVELFQTVCTNPQLKHFHKENKSMLAGSCFYVTVRKYHLPISVSYVSNFLGVAACKMNHSLKLMTKEFSINVQAPDPEDLIVSFLGQLNVEALNNQEMIGRMRQMLRLSKECLLSTGVGRQQLLMAVCYVSWCSLNVRKQKKLDTFRQFGRVHKLTSFVGGTTIKRVTELIQMLIDLAKNIPTINSAKVVKKTIFWHVDTILSFHSLTTSDSNPGEEDSYTFQRKSWKLNQTGDDEICDDVDSQVSSPILRDLDSSELNEADLPDAEMHEYLRNEHEIKHLERLYQATTSLTRATSSN